MKEYNLGYNDLQIGKYYTTEYEDQGLYTFRCGYKHWIRHKTNSIVTQNDGGFDPDNGFTEFRLAHKYEVSMLGGNITTFKTLSQYLKGIGKAGGYSDKRKDHYRIKTKHFTLIQLQFLNSIPGVTAKNEWRPHPFHRGCKVKYGIIRTDIKSTEKIIN